MASTTAGPPKIRKNASKSKKKSWKKNIDMTEVDSFLGKQFWIRYASYIFKTPTLSWWSKCTICIRSCIYAYKMLLTKLKSLSHAFQRSNCHVCKLIFFSFVDFIFLHFAEEQRLEERTGGVLADKKTEDIFVLDTSGQDAKAGRHWIFLIIMVQRFFAEQCKGLV